jgi:hypothetical protein
MGGIARVLIGLVVVVVLVAGGAAVYLASNLNEIVRNGVETVGPEYTGAPVTLESVDLSILSGEGELRGLVVGNPEGFEGDDAFRLSSIRVALDTSTVLDDVVVIREVLVDGAEINAILRSLRESNVQAILDNVEAATGGTSPEAEAQAPGPQVVIDRVAVTGTGASVKFGPAAPIRVSVPDIELTDIGREGDRGASVGQVLEQVIRPVIGAILDSAASGRLRDVIQEQAGGLRDRISEGARGLMDRLGGALGGGDDAEADSGTP